MARTFSLDHTHDLINVSVAKEAIVRLQRYIESEGTPDPQATNVERIKAADACLCAASYLGGHLVLIDRQDALVLREQAKEYEDAIGRVHQLEAEIKRLQAKKVSKKKKART
jgi:hypothetical protein